MQRILLALLLLCAVPALALDVNLAQPVTLKYRLLDADNQTIDGLTTSDISFWISKASSTTLTLVEWTYLDLTECGLGTYAIELDESLTDELGPLNTVIMCEPTPGSIYTSAREDVVVYAASQWQGVPVRVYVHDASDNPIPNATVQITNEAQTIYIDQQQSDVDGYADFVLGAGLDYVVRTWGVGLTFADSPDTMTVSGAMSFSVTGEEFVADSPSAPSLANVYGWLVAPDGVAREGVVVTFALQAPSSTRPVLIGEGRIQMRTTVSDTTDAQGAFSVDLIPPSSMTPAGLRYKVTISDSPSETAYIRSLVAGEAIALDSLITAN